ncbi:MAG TPA: VOC family protein [Vicinamibacterales bacterium]|nr:VOC family protein [Vicinamibacterales bacterium]
MKTIGITTQGVHHVALRSTDLARSRRFYADTLGFPVVLEAPGIFLFLAGQTAIAVRGPEAQTPAGDAFSPFRAGLDHLALACGDDKELQRVASALATAGVENTGVKVDPTLNRQYVAFKDPDRIAWEFYMAPNANLTAVTAYFDGLRAKNADDMPFASDIRFEGPIGPALRGDAAVRDFLRGVFPLVTGVRVLQMLSDGDQVAARFELDTVHGVIPAFDWFHVIDGAITEARPYYDPRPLTNVAA